MSETISMPAAWPIPLQKILAGYVYDQYSDDEDVQAIFSSQNGLAQSYLDWFNATPLSVYTSAGIFGPLLDWIGGGIYGINRPTISSVSILKLAGYNSSPYAVPLPYNGLYFSHSGTAQIATDDIYKRVLTWHLYRGDGLQFSLGWLKNRVARFLNGANGTDAFVLQSPPSITVSSGTFTIAIPNTDIGMTLKLCVQDGILALPFQYTFDVVT